MNSKLYVGNLSYEIENSEIEDLFSGIGTVLTINLVRDRDTGSGRGFGFVEMQTDKDANQAIENLNDKEFMGRNLVVNIARPERRTNRERF